MTRKAHWLWVTRPEFYFDDGADRADLDPANDSDTSGWWTCNSETKKGDLVLLWRTRPKSDIGYLIEAESDAYSIADDEFAAEHGWTYGCEYRVLHKFRNPVTVKDIRAQPAFEEWAPLRARFQGRVFRIDDPFWERVRTLILRKDPDAAGAFAAAERARRSQKVLLEEQIEDELVAQPSLLARIAPGLRLHRDPRTGRDGRQVVCIGRGGRIDLLCRNDATGDYVVVEIKNVRASPNTFGQIKSYMGWVKETLAGDGPVQGVVLARGFDPRFEACLRTTSDVSFVHLSKLGFR